MSKRATQRQRAEQAGWDNARRLDEVNAWIGEVDLDIWDVKHPVALNGYLLGVYMTRKRDGHTILATSGEQVKRLTPGKEGA